MPHSSCTDANHAGDSRIALSQAALGQEAVRDAAAVIALAAVDERTTVKYGERSIRYVHMAVGAVAENVYLQVAPPELGTVFVGAFDDNAVKAVLSLYDEKAPLGLLSIGRPAA